MFKHKLTFFLLFLMSFALILVWDLAFTAMGWRDATREAFNSSVANIESVVVDKEGNGELQPKQQESEPLDLNSDQEFYYTGWIPSWGSAIGKTSLEANAQLFGSISPVWYGVNEDGSLMDRRPADYAAVEAVATEEGIELIPAIAMFDHELFTKVLQNEANFNRHVDQLVNMAANPDYAGIDLDYESTKLDDKDKYFEFIKKLDARLEALNKKLIITVLPKWGDNVTYPSLVETRQVQDWGRLAVYADEIRIMTYDYTFSKSAYPGPIAPLTWMRSVIEYAIEQVPEDKLVLGIHLYSYEWYLEYPSKAEYEKSSQLSFTEDTNNNPQDNPGQARAYTYNTVKKAIGENKGEEMDYEGERIFRYQKTNDSTGKYEDRVLVYLSPQGVQERIDLAKEYNLKGVAFWRLGNEAELLTEIDTN